MKKITKKEMFMEILKINDVANNPTMVEFLNHEIELLNKKRSSGTLTAKQIENEAVKNEIVTILTNTENAMSVTEIVKTLEGDYTNQKISALMVQLVKENKVKREVTKKVARFSVE